MKPRLYICVKNPFTKRDYERFGIAILERHFELEVLDCTPWLLPIAHRTRAASGFQYRAIRMIGSFREFESAITGGKGRYALDYVGQFSPSAVLMFEAIRRAGIKLVVVDSGSHPAHATRQGRLDAIIRILRHGGLRLRINALGVRLMLRVLPVQNPDIALVAGNSWTENPRFANACVQVPAHSFDYELFLRCKNEVPLAATPYVVYLDERITSHEDNKELGFADPATAGRFYPSLLAFLDKLERRLGLRVVVAGYPGGDLGELGQRMGGREVFIGQTPRLLRDASLVLAHGSTAISHAVISRRPVVILTSCEISRSWYQASIELLRRHLGANIVCIDGPESAWPVDWFVVNKKAYDKYLRTFIKSADSPDASLWDILACATRELETLSA